MTNPVAREGSSRPRCGLLGILPAQQRRRALAILRDADRVELWAGERVQRARFARAVVVVVRLGLVAVATEAGGARRPVILALAGPEDVLAPPRPGEIVLALEDAALTLLGDDVYAALLALPGAADVIVRGLSDAVHGGQDTMALFGSVSHPDRVREKLIQLARAHGRVRPDGIVIDLPLTHELLAWMIGSARETVTAALGRLELDGFVSREGRRYVIKLPPDALES